MPNPSEAGGRAWVGRWIQAEDDADPQVLHRVGFRRDVDVRTRPARLPIRISTDSRYVLWINGREVGRGPVRSQPARWTYDEYDIAPDLTPGVNSIAVLVTHYGTDNAMWQSAPVREGLGSRACLVVDAPEEWAAFATDDRWRARRLNAWSNVPGNGVLAALPIEILDQRRLDPHWHTGTAQEFAAAQSARAQHPGSGHRDRPPAYPYGALRARGIAPLDGDYVAVQSASVHRPGQVSSTEPVTSVREALAAVGPASSATWHGGGEEAGPSGPVLWQFDFTRIVAGFAEMHFDAPAGTVFDIAYLERPMREGEDERYVPRAGARVIAAGGQGVFRALETNGVRIAAVLVTPPTPSIVRVGAFGVRENLYPFTGDASFASSDEDLERLWHAGVRTVQVNSSDAFTDCPTREQRAWVGDGVVHLGVHLVTNSDWRLAERHLELCDSPRADGLLPMSVVGDIEAASRYSIPDWSLHWIHSLWIYGRASKRREFVSRRLASARRALAWFESFVDAEGVLSDVPEWGLADWSSVFTTGRTAILTALWARGLREFAELSDWVGNDGDAAYARTLYSAVARGFECFWDEARGLYVDHILDGERMPATSQAGNAAAIVAGLVPAGRAAGVVEKIIDEQRLVTRSWNAPSPTVSLAQKVADRAAGVQRIDWDAQTEIVRAEPFFSAVVHDAVALAGSADRLPGLLKRWLRFLDDGYDTFGECWEWGTPCHGWSSTPTRDLVVHILGVQPRDLESDVYRIAPAKTGVRRLSADVPTRSGGIRVEIDGTQLRLRSPLPVEVVAWSGVTLRLPEGVHSIDLQTGEVGNSGQGFDAHVQGLRETIQKESA